MEKKHFSNTMLGSWLKVFVSVLIVLYLSMGKGIFDLDWESIKCLLSAAFSSTLPVIYNYLNPNDPRYGKNKQQ